MKKTTTLVALATVVVLGVMVGGCGDDSPSWQDKREVGDVLEEQIASSGEAIAAAEAAQKRLAAADRPETAKLLSVVNAALRSAKHGKSLLFREYRGVYGVETQDDLMEAREAAINLYAASRCLVSTVVASERLVAGTADDISIERLFCSGSVRERFPRWYGGARREDMSDHRDLLLLRQQDVVAETVRLLASAREVEPTQ